MLKSRAIRKNLCLEEGGYLTCANRGIAMEEDHGAVTVDCRVARPLRCRLAHGGRAGRQRGGA